MGKSVFSSRFSRILVCICKIKKNNNILFIDIFSIFAMENEVIA